MKIIKNPDRDNNAHKRHLRETVLKECYTCPFCGEERLFDGGNYGILDEKFRTEYIKTGFMKQELMQINTFECVTCGAKWESDPFKNIYLVDEEKVQKKKEKEQEKEVYDDKGEMTLRGMIIAVVLGILAAISLTVLTAFLMIWFIGGAV